MNQRLLILAFERIYHVEAALSPPEGQLHAEVLRPFQAVPTANSTES